MKKSTKRWIFLASAALAGMYGYNQFVASTSTKKGLLSVTNGDFYESKNGDIFYTVQGNGSPLLLIHDAHPRSSSFEWNMMVKKLEKNYTVYTLDLLGCGRSDKPGYNYTNYLYVQLITEFIKNVIKEKTSVVATNVSASITIMVNQMNPELIDKMIFINPASLKKMATVPTCLSKAKQLLFNIPIIGTFIYNVQNNPIHIDLAFREKYYCNAQLISHKAEDVYYESAHIGESSGRFLYGSLMGDYVNINLQHALKNLDKPVVIIGSHDLKNNMQNLEEYRKINSNIKIVMITNCNLYPQLEIPEKTSNLILEHLM